MLSKHPFPCVGGSGLARRISIVVACVRLALDGNPRHTDPFVVDRGDELVDLVVAALGAADLFGHVTDIGEAFSVELRPP
jgi:hypothetical protein